jgi:ADP-heptose:LPS heptosyltransferase
MEALFSDYEAIRKSGLFDPEHYTKACPDVAERNVDPLVHYLEEGAREGRDPHPDFDTAFYLEQCRERGEEPANPLLHYLLIGAARGFQIKRGGAPASTPQTPGQATKPVILLAVEALGVAGTSDGRSRLSINGWALAAAPITEITAAIEGAVVGRATYGLPRPDIARLYRDRDHAGNSGFILSFDLPGTAGGTIEPLLTVRTEDGEIGRRPLRVDIPPQQVEVPAVDPYAEPSGEPAAFDQPPMELFIDEATVDRRGLLRIEGWVVCLVQIELVEVFVDGDRIGEAEFGRVREDVEQVRADYPNARFSGFMLVSDIGRLGAGRKTITVRARARTGIMREQTAAVEVPRLGRARRAAADDGFHHHCDEIALTTAGTVVVRGWAACPSPIASITVLLDGEEIGEAELGVERADVGNLFPSLPHARQSGFAFARQTGKSLRDEHLITLRLHRDDGEIHEIILPALASETALPATTAAGNTAGDAERRLHLDAPALVGGAMGLPLRGNLEISGWALARAGVAAVEIAIDGMPMANADYGVRRLDIQASFPDWENALGSGFLALVPHRVLPLGEHRVSVTLRDKTGKTARLEFGISVEELSDTSGPWTLRRKMPRAEIDLGLRLLQHRQWQPAFHIAMPVDSGAAAPACATIASLGAQVYRNWRLVVAAAPKALADTGLRAALDGIADRVQVVRKLTRPALLGENAGNAAFLTVLEPGDELGCDAFLEMALTTAVHPDADFLYSDERRLNPASGKVEAFFKPQWSPDLLLSANYVGRLWCARADLVRAIAGPADELLQHGDYDLALRCTETAKAIRHIPAVLCERAEAEADDVKRDDVKRDRAALERALKRRGIAGEVRPGLVAGTYRVKRALTTKGLVSIIIPTCAAQGMVKTCIETLRRRTAYKKYEIVCIENIPPADRKWRGWLKRNADRVVSTTEPYNWSRFNNLAAKAAKGEFLLFLNDDIEIIEPDWLGTLLGEAQRPEVGAVGPLLLYPDRRIQHAGLFLAAMGQGRHAFRYLAEDQPGYFGLARSQRNVIALTGACLMTRRKTFNSLGGFDEAHLVINNDLDFVCGLANKASSRSLRRTPGSSITASRAAMPDAYDATVFESKWRDLFLAGDPYLSPHLARHQDDFSPDGEPDRVLVTGGPALNRDEIRNILIVKLDHIGDCIIAFPALRRLQRHFPQARITVLTSRASKSVWALEPCVAHTIEFDFFHARSALGELELADEDWQKLRERLVPARFDLAVDLRKHPETRDVLRHTGARYLAGFDHRNLFAWLDVAIDWGGDQAYARKRQHTADDLVNLVDAIAAACEADRQVIVAPPSKLPPKLSAELARGLDKLAGAPLICVHPAAGNAMKQWPADYFATVIDRLVAAYGARIVLIGAPGEEAIADALIARLRHPDAVSSLIGKLPLAELPALLARASLFLGNDSGPKHIAAGLGVPTVGVHSGTVDVREWGPIGVNAVAVAREMVCSPCYLSQPEDCRRGLACLRELSPETVYDACERLLLLSAPQAPARAKKAAARQPARPARRRVRAARQSAAALALAGRR